MKTNAKSAQLVAWLVLIATMLLTVSAYAQARWKFQFTARVDPMFFESAVEDPEDIFNNTFQVGAPIAGEFSFELPYLNHFDMTLDLNGVQVKMDPLYETAGWFNLPYFPFDFILGGQSLDVSVWDAIKHPAEFRPSPTGEYWFDQLIFGLYDTTGGVFNGVFDIADFPLGPLPLDDLPLDQSAFAGAGSFYVFDSRNFPVVHFRATTAEASIPGGTGLYIWPGRYERFMVNYDTGEVSDDGIDQEVSEVDGSTTITVRRIGDLTGIASVKYATLSGSAAANVNYVAAGGTLTFGPGEKEQTFAVDILDDNARTLDTSFSVQFSDVHGAVPSAFPMKIRVLEKNPFPVLVAAGRIFVTNPVASVTLTLVREGDLSEPTVVDYATADDSERPAISARAGIDYVHTAGTLTFAPSEASKTATVPLLAGSGVPGRKRLSVTFTSVSGSRTPSVATKVVLVTPVPVLVDGTFNPGAGADGDVYDLISVPNGKIYALGTFTNIGGFTRPFLARLNRDGAVDPSFEAGRLNRSDNGKAKGLDTLKPAGEPVDDLDNTVNWLTPLPDNRVLLGGNFTSLGGTEQPYLARLLINGRLDTTFRPVLNGPVFRIALQADGKILIVGGFTEVNGVPRKNVARLFFSGNLDASFDPAAGPDRPALAVAVTPEGNILVGGFFDRFAGVQQARLARLLPNGQLDATYRFRHSGDPFQWVSKMIVRTDGSHFAAVGNGSPILLNPDGTQNPNFPRPRQEIYCAGAPSAMELQPDGKLVLSGKIQAYWDLRLTGGINQLYDFNTEVFTLIRLDPSGLVDFSLDPENFKFTEPLVFPTPPPALRMNEVTIQPDGKILIAGNFIQVSGVPRKGIARIITP